MPFAPILFEYAQHYMTFCVIFGSSWQPTWQRFPPTGADGSDPRMTRAIQCDQHRSTPSTPGYEMPFSNRQTSVRNLSCLARMALFSSFLPSKSDVLGTAATDNAKVE